ncbi:hypothetical protein ONE63_007843 [Megalurothrips usitatus]|uniref:Nucleolar protein 12 n=1 Tax=Megalurothrips usitatus TaxID=439358 RepID=A0AAV7XT76_9NEOP|nr:hypothetical protein ONE63_007843 [Megalurothrips usitatus]
MAKKKKTGKNANKEKISLVFDPSARRDFLKGFHKRKVQRKEKFKEDLKQMMKTERKKIKANAKGTYKTLVVSHRPCPEVEHLLNEEHDLGSHSVEIKELSTQSLAEDNNWIGENRSTYGREEEEEGEESEEEVESDSELPGMDLKVKPVKKPKVTKEESSTKPVTNPLVGKKEFKTAKELKKVIKKQSSKQVKKSKVYQMKSKLDRSDCRKKSMKANNRLSKIKESSKKGKRSKKLKEKKRVIAARTKN